MNTSRGLLIYCLLALLLSCSSPTDPWRPDGHPYTPPPVYAEWWAEVELCVGVGQADFSRVSWFVVRGGISFDTPDFGRASGRWVPPHEIYVAEVHVSRRRVVKHEMVHDLLGGGRADDARFADCGGLQHA